MTDHPVCAQILQRIAPQCTITAKFEQHRGVRSQETAAVSVIEGTLEVVILQTV